MKRIDLVKLPIALKCKLKNVTVETKISELLHTIPGLKSMKSDINIVSYVCNQIENLYIHKYNFLKKTKRYDKKEIVIQILCQIYEDHSQDFKDKTDSQIEYLYTNNLINKISLLELTITYVTDIIKKSFLGD